MMIKLLFSILTLCLTNCLQLREGYFDYQGFGSDADYRYYSQVSVKTQSQFKLAILSNYTLITFANGTKILELSKEILLRNTKNIIIRGLIELRNYGISVINSSNIIIENIRIINSSIDGILISNSNNIILYHLTIINAGRASVQKGKCIDLTQNSTNIIVSNSIIGYTDPYMSLIKNKGILIANFFNGPVNNFSIHHNVFYCNYQRSPQISTNGLFQMQNNIIFNWTQYGTRVRNGAYGNIENNIYVGQRKDPLVIQSSIQLQINQQQSSIFIKNNLLKKIKNQSSNIPDTIQIPRYNVPFISFKSFKDTLKNAGCYVNNQYQSIIKRNINDYL